MFVCLGVFEAFGVLLLLNFDCHYNVVLCFVVKYKVFSMYIADVAL